MTKIPSTELIYDIFSQLNDIPRPSWRRAAAHGWFWIARDDHSWVLTSVSVILSIIGNTLKVVPLV